MSKLEFLSMARTQLSAVKYDLEKCESESEKAQLLVQKAKFEQYIKDHE